MHLEMFTSETQLANAHFLEGSYYSVMFTSKIQLANEHFSESNSH